VNESVYRGINWPGESKIRIQRIQEASPPISGSFDIKAYGHILKGIFKNFQNSQMDINVQNIGLHICMHNL
jgi:hypothetical protein